jgi:D-alanyl-D-alanine carboxypeptidase (penicillin-binding protein 5/6)
MMTFVPFRRLHQSGGFVWFLLAGLSLTAISVGEAAAQKPSEPPAKANDESDASPGLGDVILPLVKAHQGRVAVAVKHLKTGEAFAHRDDEPMPTASLIKFPVMIEAYRQAHAGRIDLDAQVRLCDEDKVPGSGILRTHFSQGATFSVRDAIRLMIAYSDNTATNLVLDQIGLAATGETMQAWNLPNTRIHAKVFRADTSIAPDRSKKFGLGSTTAAEMVRLLERLERKDIVSAKASEEMLGHLLACEDKDKFSKRLPSGTKIAHKTGSVSAVRTDAGIVYAPTGPIALCVLTAENKDQRWEPDNAGNRLCADIAWSVFRYFESRADADGKADDADLDPLKIGASGELVQALQRTLNDRLSPSPGLTVDGEFGRATQTAVIRFQRSQKLAANGIVGPETWKALGSLVPDSDETPSEEKPKSPRDAAAGQPFVTCSSWAIGDPKTGKLLWSDNPDQRLEMASTTKIMTAYVVLHVAAKDAKLLDREVTFSTRADRTEGTTSKVRAGEKLSIRQLLYGLLVPSGNDAAVALAEAVGRQFAPAGKSSKVDSVSRFVAEMNRTAERLGLKDTRFTNPHGLPDEDHVTTARDLLKLAATAMKDRLFREIVSTRQYTCQVTSARGYKRNVVWRNTNKLLDIEGYSGVKTGTTAAAGACLVSLAQRSGDELLVVVLGASSSDARYSDTRNLFRWAWQQRGIKE